MLKPSKISSKKALNVDTVNDFTSKADILTEFSPIVREKIEEERKTGEFEVNFLYKKIY